MNPDEKIKFDYWFLKLDPPMWIDADFECMIIPVDDPHQKALIVNKLVGVSYNISKEPIL